MTSITDSSIRDGTIVLTRLEPGLVTSASNAVGRCLNETRIINWGLQDLMSVARNGWASKEVADANGLALCQPVGIYRITESVETLVVCTCRCPRARRPSVGTSGQMTSGCRNLQFLS